MEGPLESRPELRISDADRHRVAEVLREAAGDGRIDLAELDERLEATYAARTYADLVPITGDLPTTRAGASTAPVVPSSGMPAERHLAILSGFERRGVWTVPAEMRIVAVMGGAQLDMRDATFGAREVVVTVHAVMGGVEIVVGPDVDVVMEGSAVMGGHSGPSQRHAVITADSPRLRVRGFAFWGGVSVTRKR
jgi:hypothetical protein